jgi:hypothetical protein
MAWFWELVGAGADWQAARRAVPISSTEKRLLFFMGLV